MANDLDATSLRRRQIRWGLSAHGRRLLTLAVAGLVAAVLTRRPEFAGLAAPAVLLLAAWPLTRPDSLEVEVVLEDSQVLEDTPTAVVVRVAGQGRFTAEVSLDPADLISAGPGAALPPEAPGRRRAVARARLYVTARRWGYRPAGLVTVTLLDRFRLTEGTVHVSVPWLDCRPSPAQLRSLVVLSKLPSRLGEHPARVAGEGIEFSGIREYAPGDRQRRVNWAATTRSGRLHLSTFAAERTQHTVVIADATTDVGEPGSSSLDLVLRGAAGVIQRYITARDRVGAIVIGSRLNWIGPGQGRRHLHRLLQLLVSTPSGWDRVSGLARLPRAALPPGSLVLVVSPLLDPRITEAVRDLRERGFTILVVDVLNASPAHDGSRLSVLTSRLWRLEQDAIRFSLAELGVPVVHWDGVSSLDEPLRPVSRHPVVTRR